MLKHEDILKEPKNIKELLEQNERDMKELQLKIDGLQMVYQKLYLIQLWLENIERSGD